MTHWCHIRILQTTVGWLYIAIFYLIFRFRSENYMYNIPYLQHWCGIFESWNFQKRSTVRRTASWTADKNPLKESDPRRQTLVTSPKPKLLSKRDPKPNRKPKPEPSHELKPETKPFPDFCPGFVYIIRAAGANFLVQSAARRSENAKMRLLFFEKLIPPYS